MTSPANVPNPEYPAESEQPSAIPEREDDLREDPEPLEKEEPAEDEGEEFEEDDELEEEEESPDSNEQESREP